MIVVRDIFQVKFGRMKEVKDLMKEMMKIAPPRPDMGNRLLTDLTGPYYTLVMERTYKDLASYEKEMQAGMSQPEFGALYQKFSSYVDSGKREIFTIVQ
jgi:hypothetical protein